MDINRYIPRRIVHSVVTAMLLGLIMGHLGFSQSCISASSSIYPWHKCAAGRPADTHRFRWRHHSEHDAILHRTLGFRGGSSPPPPFPSKVSQKWSANIQGNPSSTSKPVRYPIVHDITEDQSKSKWLGTSTRDSKNRNIFDTKQAIDAFLTRDSRNSFISRVYAILTGQLIATVISILTFSANRNWAVWLLTEGKLSECFAL